MRFLIVTMLFMVLAIASGMMVRVHDDGIILGFFWSVLILVNIGSGILLYIRKF